MEGSDWCTVACWSLCSDCSLSAGYKKILEEWSQRMNEQEFTVTSDFRLPSDIEHLFKRHRLHPSHWGYWDQRRLQYRGIQVVTVTHIHSKGKYLVVHLLRTQVEYGDAFFFHHVRLLFLEFIDTNDYGLLATQK